MGYKEVVRQEKWKAIQFLDAMHRMLCEEIGEHPDERETAYSYGADALRKTMGK